MMRFQCVSSLHIAALVIFPDPSLGEHARRQFPGRYRRTHAPATVSPMSDRLCLLTVHAHPDDEASKGACTVARYHAEGVRTVLVCCTGGEEGDILNPAMDTPEVRADIAGVRLRELQAAAEIIGYDRVMMLGYRDSGMAGTPRQRRPQVLREGAARRSSRPLGGGDPRGAAPGGRHLRGRPAGIPASRPLEGPRDHCRCLRGGRGSRSLSRNRRPLEREQGLLHRLVRSEDPCDARQVPGARAWSRPSTRRGWSVPRAIRRSTRSSTCRAMPT